MADVKVEVVRVRGICNADFKKGDSFLLRGLRIVLQGNDKACRVAFASIVTNIGRLRLQGSPIYVSCPDPGTGDGGNVIFGISVVESHEEDQH